MIDHLALLEGEVVAMTAALAAADPAQPVAACPGWTARELAAHVTGVHRWVLAALQTDTRPVADETPLTGDLAGSYEAAAREMLAALRALPADHACWTFDRENRTAGFWRRRQVHEISVHRWDLAPYALGDELAADGIDEVLELMLPLQVRAGRAGLPDGTLVLTSPTRTWRVGEGPETPDSTVSGTAGELLLRLWGRGTPLPGPWATAHLTP